jgi:chorismate mutase/prephenate dehydratase
VFDEVVRGTRTTDGPVEYSLHGGVVDTLDAFSSSSAKIYAEVKITVHHNLDGGRPWETVNTVLSKPEVFSQCRKWLQRRPGPGTCSRPPARARRRAGRSTPGVAAIGSALAGELHGLHVLVETSRTTQDNQTRFFVLSREGARKTGDDKTAIMFTTAHKPGALAEVLDVFKERGST